MDATEKVVEAAQETIDELAEQDVDSVDSEVRYLAYGARLRTALRTGTRYIAYVRTRHSMRK
jgi:mitochondrial fission process protein 1